MASMQSEKKPLEAGGRPPRHDTRGGSPPHERVSCTVVVTVSVSV